MNKGQGTETHALNWKYDLEEFPSFQAGLWVGNTPSEEKSFSPMYRLLHRSRQIR